MSATSFITNEWPEKLRLLSVLSVTKEFLVRSQNEGWSDEQPLEAIQEIDKIISYLFDSDSDKLSKHTLILYAPTGLIQEISISNGWSDIYTLLSNEYDKLKHLIK